MGKINIKDLVKLIFSCVIILYLAVVRIFMSGDHPITPCVSIVVALFFGDNYARTRNAD